MTYEVSSEGRMIAPTNRASARASLTASAASASSSTTARMLGDAEVSTTNSNMPSPYARRRDREIPETCKLWAEPLGGASHP